MKTDRRLPWLLSFLLLGMLIFLRPSAPAAIEAQSPTALSPMWPPNIQQWDKHIAVLADVYGVDPDLIAAVIREESNGRTELVSEAGAVGLMGVMSTGPGLEWRPSIEELKNPAVNLRWGVGILSEIIQQAGGDVGAALAAYSGGWQQVNNRVPRAYAASVLNNYAQAVMVRSGQSPDIASQWTIAIELNRGHVPNEPILILGEQPEFSTPLFGKHLVYSTVDTSGKGYYIVGYAVPVDLPSPLDEESLQMMANPLEELPPSPAAPLVSTSSGEEKVGSGNLHILLACLPSLERLRGQSSTRWFGPSHCPPSQR